MSSLYRHPIDRGRWPLATCAVCGWHVARSPHGKASRHKRIRLVAKTSYEWCPGSGKPVAP